MRKSLAPAVAVVCIIAGLSCVHYFRNTSPQEITQAPEVITGEEITFTLTYHGRTGENESLISAAYLFRDADFSDSTFIASVKEQAENDVHITHNPLLVGREFSAVEHKDEAPLFLYFDVNADGQLSDNEKLPPTDIPGAQKGGPDVITFRTPDFRVTDQDGQHSLFRVILLARIFFGNFDINWTMMGLYEGVARLGGKDMKLVLNPHFASQSYTQYGRSYWKLSPAANEKTSVTSGGSFSSLIQHDGILYRVKVKGTSEDGRTLQLAIAEDKSPRGKFAFNFQGKEGFKFVLGGFSLHSVHDKTIQVSLRGKGAELPVGEYVASSGRIGYGKNEARGYLTFFDHIPAFSVKKGETTTVNLGNVQAGLRIIKLKNRHKDVQNQTEFDQGDSIFIDTVFRGASGEIYSCFKHLNNKDLNNTLLKIYDCDKREIISGKIEYG